MYVHVLVCAILYTVCRPIIRIFVLERTSVCCTAHSVVHTDGTRPGSHLVVGVDSGLIEHVPREGYHTTGYGLNLLRSSCRFFRGGGHRDSCSSGSLVPGSACGRGGRPHEGIAFLRQPPGVKEMTMRTRKQRCGDAS